MCELLQCEVALTTRQLLQEAQVYGRVVPWLWIVGEVEECLV